MSTISLLWMLLGSVPYQQLTYFRNVLTNIIIIHIAWRQRTVLNLTVVLIGW